MDVEHRRMGRRAHRSPIAARVRWVTVAAIVTMVASLLPVGPASAGLLDGARFTVQFEKASYSKAEDGGVATLTLVRSGDFLITGAKSVVRVRSTGGTATVGEEYPAVDTKVVFDGTQKTAFVQVPLVADDRYERDETITFFVKSESSNTEIGTRRNSTLTVANDDAPPTLSVSVPEAAVEGAPVQAKVTLTGVSDVPTDVDYMTADGTAIASQDYETVRGTLTFPPGTLEQTIAVPTIEDEVHEPSEMFSVNLSNPVDATITTASASAGINDDDVAHLLSIADASSSEGGTAKFTVTLTRASNERIAVEYGTEDGTAVAPGDYTSTAGTLTIEPGQTTGTISVPTASDSLPEPDEQFTVRLWNPQGAAIGFGTAVGTIKDAAPLPIVSIGHAATVLEGGLASFRVTLSEPSSSEVTVRVTPQSGSASVGVEGSGADVFAPAEPATATFDAYSVTADVTFEINNDLTREDPEKFRAVLSHASGAVIGTDRAEGVVRDDDQCVALSAPDRRTILERWLNRLDPDADDDGDGFTNGEEVGVLAFDPDADPTRFNPLIADTPTVDVTTIGDLSVALMDKLTNGKEVGRVKIRESELLDVNRQEDVHSTTEGHEVGVSVEGSKGVEDKKPKASIKVGVDYRYSRSTTDQHTSEITRGARELRSQELSTIQSSGEEIEGGSIAVTVRMTNTGNVAFRVESAPVILRYRDDAGTLLAFGTMTPNFEFGQGPTLSPGQSKDVLYEITGVGATDTLALLEDASNLVLGLSDALELSEIGVGAINVGAGNFAQYQNTIGQNTASLDVDDGLGGTDRYLVSTTSFRDPNGRPLGIAMCDAVQVLLQRQLHVDHGTFDVFEGGEQVAGETVSSILLGVGTGGASDQLVEAKPEVNADWITNAHIDAVSGEEYYGPRDVILRARQAAQLVHFQDQDLDGLELREELIHGTKDTNPDSDGDCSAKDAAGVCVDDRFEATEFWPVVVKDRAGNVVRDYPVRSDPASADVDGDGVSDPTERARRLDPWLADTDRDEQFGDAADGVLGPNGLAGAYGRFGWYELNGSEYPFSGSLDSTTPVMVSTDANVDFTWSGSPGAGLPADGFGVRWTGSLAVVESGEYTLGGVADNGFRLYVNGAVVADGWSTAADTEVFGAPITLKANEPVSIVYEMWEGSGTAQARLLFKKDGAASPVPQAWLAPDPAMLDKLPAGLSAEHFFDIGKTQTLDPAQVMYKTHDAAGPNHDWGTGSPLTNTVPYDYFISRWTGYVTVPAGGKEGQYHFGGKHDEDMRVTLDGNTVYDIDGKQESPNFESDTVELKAGTPVPIEVVYSHKTGPSYVELWMTPPGGTPQPVPAEWFTPTTAFTQYQRPLPPTRIVKIKNQAANNITIKLTWGAGEVGCNEELVGSESHDCQIPGRLFHGRLEIRKVDGIDSSSHVKTLVYDLPPSSDECHKVTGNLGGNTVSPC